MDDVWETKVWDGVKRLLPNDDNGSRVMLTTRLLDIAVYAGLVHHMQFLSEDQSWNLLCQKVPCPPQLKEIGRLIAKNCRGLPLAIVVAAGLLSNVNQAHQDWEKIARNISSAAVDQNDQHLSKILSLSYNHLPHHLKPCFLYLGGFPEDYKIRVSKLIKLWVAEGFLKPIESKSLEEVGQEYLKELVNRNLVLVTEKKSFCSIHDLLRDLCLQRCHHENFLHCLHKKEDFHRKPLGNVRRLSVQMWKDSLFHKYKKKHLSHVRAILSFEEVWGYDQRQFLSLSSGLKLLRVLDTRSMLRCEFPEVIVDLLHLRYLALDASRINIPPSIFKLQNLQTLIFNGPETSLPSEIWKMPQLRHLIFGDVTLPPIHFGEIRVIDGAPLLGMLQTLSRVLNFRFTQETIEMIPSLKKLKIQCITYGPHQDCLKFDLNNLQHLRQLETLEISFHKLRDVVAPFPENFVFPSTLIKLSLYGCRLPWEDPTVVASLPNLQKLKLTYDAFVGEEWETKEGEFSRLKFLVMERLHDLKCWRVESSHFPCLEQLHIKSCYKLEEIPSEIGDIPTLQLIKVQNCYSEAVVSSAFKIQDEQLDLGNDDLQVRLT